MTKTEAVQVNLIYLIFRLVHFWWTLVISIGDLNNGVLSVDGYGHDLLHKYDKEIKLIEW